MKKLFALCILSLSLFADVYDVTLGNYSAVVEQSSKPVIIDFYAPWCPHCQQMAPLMEEASTRYPNIRFAKINCDNQAELAERFSVDRLPTLLFILPGKNETVFRSIGTLSETGLNEKIKQFLKIAIESKK